MTDDDADEYRHFIATLSSQKVYPLVTLKDYLSESIVYYDMLYTR
jgi:hypothetical protein